MMGDLDHLMEVVSIAGHEIGPGRPTFIIAEAGVNHDGDPTTARELVKAARAAGATAVKFQTFRTDRLVRRSAPKLSYQREVSDDRESQWEMLKRLELPASVFRDLRSSSEEEEILFLSTPFDEESADLLEELGVPAFKLSSADLTNHSLLAHVAAKRKPLILSTGMAFLEEVKEAVKTVREHGCRELVLLHCTSVYPAPAEECNLASLKTLRHTFHTPVGYSDHTLGWEIAVAAVAMGACVLEKHLTLSRSRRGPDHKASLEPDEFAAMTRAIRRVEAARGDGVKRPSRGEEPMRESVRRRIVAAHRIPPGTSISSAMLTFKRAEEGFDAREVQSVLGRIARVEIEPDTPILDSMLQ